MKRMAFKETRSISKWLCSWVRQTCLYPAPRRRFVPEQVNPLEGRSVPSSGLSSAAGLKQVHAITIDGLGSQTSGFKIIPNAAYEAGSSQRLDVYEPTGTPPRGGWPVILAIHGGGWYTTDKSQWGPKVAAQYLPLGYAVVVPNYTLSTTTSPSWPAAFHDVMDASIWTHQHAAHLQLNPKRIVALGESAGGELAGLLGTIAANPAGVRGAAARVAAVVSFYGPMDLASMAHTNAEVNPRVVQYLGGTDGQLPQAYDAASPTHWVRPGDPPMLLIHGTADPIVPFSQSAEMADVLSAAGVSHQLIAVTGAGHAFEFASQGQALLPQIVAFLNQAMGTSTPTAIRPHR
jgi:acetyl esterase/lipase